MVVACFATEGFPEMLDEFLNARFGRRPPPRAGALVTGCRYHAANASATVTDAENQRRRNEVAQREQQRHRDEEPEALIEVVIIVLGALNDKPYLPLAPLWRDSAIAVEGHARKANHSSRVEWREVARALSCSISAISPLRPADLHKILIEGF